MVVLHDLDQAVAHADHLVVVHEGRIRAMGHPVEVLDTTLTEEVFGCRSAVVEHPLTGRPHLVTAPRAQSP